MVEFTSTRKPDMELSIGHLSRAEQFKIWQQISARIGDVTYDTETEQDDTPFKSIAWNLGPMLLTETSFPVSTMERTKRHIALGNADYVRVRIFGGGFGTSVVNGRKVDVVPGEVHFVHGSSEVWMRAQAVDILGLLIPYDALDIDPASLGGYFSASARSATGRIITSAIQTALAEMPYTEPGEIPALAAALMGMVRGLLTHVSPEDSDRQAFAILQGHAVRQYVDAHLMDTDLTVERLSSIFGASRASIYRHFPEGEGLMAYVKNRRLDRCLLELVRTEKSRGAVRRVSERWGYADASHFFRLFRDRFGVAPSEVLGLSLGAGEAVGTIFPDFSFLLQGDLDGRSLIARLQDPKMPECGAD
ncbi:MAG: AraC family transcriptional regulator [Pseudomonadota bacterium]